MLHELGTPSKTKSITCLRLRTQSRRRRRSRHLLHVNLRLLHAIMRSSATKSHLINKLTLGSIKKRTDGGGAGDRVGVTFWPINAVNDPVGY